MRKPQKKIKEKEVQEKKENVRLNANPKISREPTTRYSTKKHKRKTVEERAKEKNRKRELKRESAWRKRKGAPRRCKKPDPVSA